VSFFLENVHCICNSVSANDGQVLSIAVLMIPLFFENAISVCKRAVQLTSLLPTWALVVNSAVSAGAERVLGRESVMTRPSLQAA
jgi:hypothetical protein